MVDVFVSRPNWIPDEFQAGLENFLGLLDGFDLNPKTIGSNVYPINSPLDAVLELLDRCQGLVVLGIPQAIMRVGTIKDIAITEDEKDELFPTEWNHIEASLAYSKHLPVLVMHHTGINRGVFDPRAISRFVYEIDMTDPAWPLEKQIQGALQTWIESVNEYETPKFPMMTEVDSISSSVENLSGDLLTALTELSRCTSGRSDAPELAGRMNVGNQKAVYLLDELRRRKLVSSNTMVRGVRRYGITHDGRSVLHEAGLLQ